MNSTCLKMTILLLGSLLWVGCPASSQVRTNAVTQGAEITQTTLSLRKLNCQSCGARVVRVLKRQKGIQSVEFDKNKAELTVAYHKPTTNEKSVIQNIESMGYQALVGPGKGAYVPFIKFEKTMDVQWVAQNGEKVTFSEHLAPQKITIFDFYAKWCGPCKEVDRALYQMMLDNKQVAVRKINVVDWNRPVVKQHMQGVSQLPYLIIYDKNGKKVKALVGNKIKELKETIRRLSGS